MMEGLQLVKQEAQAAQEQAHSAQADLNSVKKRLTYQGSALKKGGLAASFHVLVKMALALELIDVRTVKICSVSIPIIFSYSTQAN